VSAQENSKLTDTQLILRRHIRLVLWVAPLFCIIYAVVAYVYQNWVLAACGGLIVIVVITALIASTLLDRGRVRAAALTVGHTINFVVFAVSLIAPELAVVAPTTLFIAVVFVIPHVSGAELRPFLIVNLLIGVLSAMAARVLPSGLLLPENVYKTIVSLIIIAESMTALALLYQFSGALKDNLAKALAAKNALSRSERAQREERVKLATTLDNIAIAVVKLSADLRIAYINPVARNMLGVKDDVIGEDVGKVLTLVTPDANITIHSIERIARHQSCTLPLPNAAEIQSRDGTLYPVEGTYTPLAPSGAVLSFRDVGERLRLDALRNEKEAAEAAAAARTQFLANMSHEIRTPMNAVIGMTGLLLDTKLDKTQLEFVDTIRSSGTHLLSIINDILDFSRLDSGVIEFEHYAYDVRTCIEEALELVAPMAAEKNIELCFIVGKQVYGSIMGDAGRLRQVLVNFVGNAIKFTEQGEVVVQVDQEPLAGDQVRLRFSVSDTGVGISPEQISRLFKPFGQADASTTRKFGGTGLGLVISQQIIERMGGSVDVKSTVGAGSTFTFEIVAFAVPGRVIERNVIPELQNKRLLIVDDNATNRGILCSEAKNWGMVAEAVDSGAKALESLKSQKFDIALLDFHMPVMDGVNLAQKIRNQLGNKSMPLVLLSSLGMVHEAAQQDLFHARLSKPVRASILLEQLTALLSSSLAKKVPPAKPSDHTPIATKTSALRILLAEDNPVNQRVATLILQKIGYRADVVANGLEAVNAIGRQHYDVILMDVQMPEMDGLEATRTICQKYPRDKRPRIIAMTAHVMAGDRERCLEAGMDDYLNKPIELVALGAALARSERKTEQSSGKMRAVQVIRFNPSRLDSLNELAKVTGEDVVTELVHAFIADAEKSFEAMKGALHAREAKTLERTAHSFKSTCATLGGEHMAQLCQILENQSRIADFSNASELISTLRQESSLLQSELKKYLAAQVGAS
jgi:signal transduction histidine kinase/DNA-binding response OmpR family regulator